MKKLLYLIILFNFIQANQVFAAPDDDLSHQRQQIIQQQLEQQRQFQDNQQQLRETQRIRKAREAEGLVEPIEDGIEDMEDTANCHRFNRIELFGNKEYSIKYLNKRITNNYIGKCINKNNVKLLQTELTKLYIDGGYTTTRIYFDLNKSKINELNPSDNVFVIVIEEGKIGEINLREILPDKKNKNKKEKTENEAENKATTNPQTSTSNNQNNSQFQNISITPPIPTLPIQYTYVLSSPEVIAQKNYQLEKSKKYNQFAELKQLEKDKKSKLSFWERRKQSRLKRQVFFAFPLKANRDKIFNIRDFEQGLDQLNRLQSNNATMELNPSLYTIKSLERIEKKEKTNTDINIDLIGTPQAGYSNVLITNDRHKSSRTTFLSAGVDNSGSQSTGEILGNISISQDNLLAMNDNIYLKYTQNIDGNGKLSDDNNYNPNYNNLGTNDDKNNRYNKSFYSNISVPLGYWTFSSSLNYSRYLTTIAGYYSSFESSGNTFTQNYTIDRTMYRTQLYRMNMGTNLELRDTESYIRDIKSETGSRKSSNVNLFINNTIYTKLGTIIIKPSYQRGLDWLGSKEDANNLLKNEPKLQYELLKLYAYYNTRINMPLFTKTKVVDPSTGQLAMKEIEKEIIKRDEQGNILLDKDNKPIMEKIKDFEPMELKNKINLNYTITLDSQYSFDTLYGTNQFSVGGEYTVRGFRNSNISGDNAYYVRNDLKMSLQQLFPKYILSKDYMSFGNKIKDKQYNLSLNDALSRSYIGIFYDYGYVEDKYEDSSDKIYNSGSGYMSGTGIALNYYGKYLNWSLTYAKALHSPRYLQTRDNIKKENSSLYWRVGVRW